MDSVKDLVDSQRAADEELTAKRIKLQCDIDMEKIRSKKQIAQTQVECNKRIAQTQANTQVKQMEVVAYMIQQIIEVLRPQGQGMSITVNS